MREMCRVLSWSELCLPKGVICFGAASLMALGLRVTLNTHAHVCVLWWFVERGPRGAELTEALALWLGIAAFLSACFLTGPVRHNYISRGLNDQRTATLVILGLLDMTRKTVLCVWPAAYLELGRPTINQPADMGPEDSWPLSPNIVT